MKIYRLTLLLIVVFTLFSCKKDNDKPNGKPKAFASYEVTDDIFRLHGEKSTDPDMNNLRYKWTTTSGNITVINEQSSIAHFINPYLPADETVRILLTVSDGELQDTVSFIVDIPATNKLERWGLGTTLQKEASNNKDYEWYLDQLNTGTYSDINCGPTSVTMAIKWFNQSSTLTPADARNTYWPNGGWWYTYDITNYLNNNGVYNGIIELDSIGMLREQIDRGNIAILCLDVFYIRFTDIPSYHVNKYYMTTNQGCGHFIVIKGYKVVDNKTYYEVYDPNSWGITYADFTLKGKDRYYLDEDLDIATNIWWNYAIIVSGAPIKGMNTVDPSKIEHKTGR
ncbi:MAG: hypothetical protein CVU06_00115 [Bacteroidetes bacterium HGW-Bacteroidetes-22]|nr:MAG: hypothetical protein CVU06_00115 [Bacteroidetes bacterium HGW-Bacteroidetes-22]